ncbi:MAG: sugar phosphate nucleotidyltransferase [Thermoflexales bacterium]|nr:sugar phosphate nucleotidyltransferase [Thermoflexales bacterium]
MDYALIMAGGGGTRLWPLSRRQAPKQQLPLVEARSMFHVTVERLYPLIPAERIFVVTNAEAARVFQHQVPALPPGNYILEPSAKDSGPAAALGLVHIARRDPDATVAVLPADHHISNVPAFLAALQAAQEAARWGYIVTLGIQPSCPATGFGYIEQGEPIGSAHGLTIYRALRFTEKPSLEVAQQYLASGRHVWNSGMFIMTCVVGLAEFERQQPNFAQALRALSDAIGTPRYSAALAEAWEAAPRLSLDYAIMEGAERMAVIPVEIGWSDIGNWDALLAVLPKDHDGNALSGDVLAVDTHGVLVRGSDRLIVTLGLHDVIIVDTPDALLVCARDRAADLKQVVDQLRALGREEVL